LFFSILPFAEQQSVYDWSKLAADPTKPKANRAVEMIATIIPGHNCPSRRVGQVLAAPTVHPGFLNATNPAGAWCRSDYAVNGGTPNRGADGKWGRAAVDDDGNGTVDDLNDAGWSGSDDTVVTWDYNPPSVPFLPLGNFKYTNGIGYQRSEVSILDLKDGASNTYLVGEKFMNMANYMTGQDPGDRDPALSGGYGLFRWGHVVPMQDRLGPTAPEDPLRFGSAHSGVFYVAMCDNSVREVSFDVQLSTHKQMANYWDSQP
jgi:hypothetical protein